MPFCLFNTFVSCVCLSLIDGVWPLQQQKHVTAAASSEWTTKKALRFKGHISVSSVLGVRDQCAYAEYSSHITTKQRLYIAYYSTQLGLRGRWSIAVTFTVSAALERRNRRMSPKLVPQKVKQMQIRVRSRIWNWVSKITVSCDHYNLTPAFKNAYTIITECSV